MHKAGKKPTKGKGHKIQKMADVVYGWPLSKIFNFKSRTILFYQPGVDQKVTVCIIMIKKIAIMDYSLFWMIFPIFLGVTLVPTRKKV